MQIDNPLLMEEGLPFAKGLQEIIIYTQEPYLNMQPTFEFPRGRISVCADLASKNLDIVLLPRCETDMVSLKAKIVINVVIDTGKPVREETLQFVQEEV